MMLLLISSSVHAADGTRVSLGAYYATGDYGTSTTTTVESLSLGIRHKSGPWTFRVAVPWLRIRGAANVLPDGQTTAGPATSRRRSGLGDIGVTAGRLLWSDSKGHKGLSLRGKMKLPTADKDEGLGTGETDVTIELAPFASLGRTTVFGAIGYRKYGDTASTDYNDVWLGRIGFSRLLTPSQSGGLMASYRQNTRAGNEDKRSLMAFYTIKWKPGWKLQSYLIKGFSDATADIAAGASLMKEY